MVNRDYPYTAFGGSRIVNQPCLERDGSRVWWLTPVIPTLEKLRQDDPHELEA